MGVLGLFKKRGRFNKHKYDPDLWAVDDDNVIVMYFYGNIGLKCRYGENLPALNSAERVFYVTQSLETEVNNGGFREFFNNPSGAMSGEIIHAFRAIGADHTARICKAALEAFGGDVPEDLHARRERLSKLDETAFDDCDDAFYCYEDDLTALNCAYIRRNNQHFSV